MELERPILVGLDKLVLYRRKIEGAKRELKLAFWIGRERLGREERERVTEDSRMEGRRGVLRREENQPMKDMWLR